MKNLLLISSLFIIATTCMSQPGEWVWLHGSSSTNSPGSFGVQGVSAPTNVPPGIYEACEWTDQNGNFWLFGGLMSSFSEFADVWKYNSSLNEWTWMKGTGLTGDPANYGTIGVPSPTNTPGGRAWGMASWVDLQGNFWMFGGSNSSGVWADLWRYEPATNNWTWMKGPQGTGSAGVYGVQGVPDPANFPGARYETAATWTDNSGDLWLFGGSDFGAFRDDLWRYNISSNEWTWMKGDQFPGAVVAYGTQGVEGASNTPGGRAVYSHWKDLNGNFWIFGGTKFSSGVDFNDLWRYNPVTNNWAWFKGGSTGAVYGTRCVPDSANTPGERFENRATITDVNGNFWLYGGGLGNSFQEVYNDLWMYCTGINQWIWVSVDTFSNPAGNWGTLGVSSPLNKPDGRGGALMWYDQNGHLYLFGGTNSAWPAMYNDIWKYTIDPACTPCSTQPQALFFAPNDICPGTCTDFTNTSLNSTSFQWTFPGGNPGVSTDANPTGICYNVPGSYDVTLIAINGANSDTITLSNYITVFPFPAAQGIIQNGDSLIANQGAVSYQWYFGGTLIPGATNYFYVAPQSGNYNVVATDPNGCEVEAGIFDVIASLNKDVVEQEIMFTLFPNPVSNELEIGNLRSGRKISIELYNNLGELVRIENATPSSEKISLDVSALTDGVYWLMLKEGTLSSYQQFLKK